MIHRAIVVVILMSAPAFAQAPPAPSSPGPAVSPVPTEQDPRAPGPISPDIPPNGPDRRPVTAPASSTMAPLEPTRRPEEAPPLAGYQNGTFFLRDSHDWFVLYPKGRLQIDGYLFPNRGSVPPTGSLDNSSKDVRPKDTIFVRRARVELLGTVIGHFDFQIAAEYASAPATGQTGTVSDAFVVVDYLTWLKLQVGQFDVPFSMENRTSDKYIDFMERSVAVRSLGVPLNKDQGAMLWGWLPKNLAYYSAGVFNGDGQSFKDQDNRPAIVGRGFVAPLATLAGRHPWMSQLWLGASFWWKDAINEGGPAAANVTGAAQNDLSSMSTQAGWTFLSTNYNNGLNAAGNAVRSHLAPWGNTIKWAVEGNLPFWRRMGLRFEVMHESVGLARYDDTNALNATLTRANGVRGTTLNGLGYYFEVYGWIIGDSTFLETPGVEPMPRLKRGPVLGPKWGLMAALKYERTGVSLTGLPSAPDGTGVDPAQGHYAVDTFEAGVNAWGTKHVRLTANYIVNYISGDSPQVKANYYYHRPEQEFLFRIGINP